MSRTAGVLTPGFAAPVHDAQQVFRAVLEAMARPLQPQALKVPLAPPAPLSPEMGAVVLALCDEQTPLWCDGDLGAAGEVEAWIRFHTGTRFVEDPGDALFHLASRPSTVPPFETLPQGTDEEPHLSATVIVDAARVEDGDEEEAEEKAEAGPAEGTAADATVPRTATGPGIRSPLKWDGHGLPAEFLTARAEQEASFPRGVDVLIIGRGLVQGLPRTTMLTAVADAAGIAAKGDA